MSSYNNNSYDRLEEAMNGMIVSANSGQSDLFNAYCNQGMNILSNSFSSSNCSQSGSGSYDNK
ncbi:hypothetical protein I4U23_023565 [Adineta vaga]|nr:hypothetical protein I4U23_023565 [Adineta vaga]